MLPSINGSQSVNHHLAGGDSRDGGDQDHLEHDHGITPGPDREGTEQRGGLGLAGRAHEQAADRPGERQEGYGSDAADRSALEAEDQEMPLELARDIGL